MYFEYFESEVQKKVQISVIKIILYFSWVIMREHSEQLHSFSYSGVHVKNFRSGRYSGGEAYLIAEL